MSYLHYIINPKDETLGLVDLHLSQENQSKIEQLLDEFRYVHLLDKFNLPVDNKILLYGHTGCGKTATAIAIAKELDKKLIMLQLGGFVSARLGETAKNITEVFRLARLDKAVLFIDEFDFIGKARDYDQKDAGEMKRLVNTLLQQIDNLNKDILLIGATNYIEAIDIALLRRFQLKLFYNLPNREQLDNFYDDLLSQYPKEYTNLVRKYNLSYAEVKDFVQQEIKKNIIAIERGTL